MLNLNQQVQQVLEEHKVVSVIKETNPKDPNDRQETKGTKVCRDGKAILVI